MGPRSRELLAAHQPGRPVDAALPWGRSAEIEVGDGYARCLRVSFVGELGYELYPTADLAVSLYDAVRRRRRRPRPAPRRLPRARLAPRARRATATSATTSGRSTTRTRPDSASPSRSTSRAASSAGTRSPGGPDETPDRRQVFVRLDDPEPLLLARRVAAARRRDRRPDDVRRLRPHARRRLRPRLPPRRRAGGQRLRGRLRRAPGARDRLRHAVLRPRRTRACAAELRYWWTASRRLPSGSNT